MILGALTLNILRFTLGFEEHKRQASVAQALSDTVQNITIVPLALTGGQRERRGGVGSLLNAKHPSRLKNRTQRGAPPRRAFKKPVQKAA